jgi:cytochrome c biogenesis protein CcmG, thiol:disulfide interchange protein DsbE
VEADLSRKRRFRPLRFLAPAVGIAAAVGLVALLAYGVIARNPDTTIDDSLARDQPIAAPSYRLAVLRHGKLGPRLERKLAPALDDGRVAASELRGTPYVLNLWASWCVPCRDEAPVLVREWRRARSRGVLFVGIDMQDADEDAGAFMDHFGVDYLALRDPTNNTLQRYGATGIPETWFISARGKIVNHVIGVITPAQLRAGIAAATAGQPEAARHGGEQRPARP